MLINVSIAMDGGAEMRPLSLSLKTIMETMIVKNTSNDNNQNNSNIKWWIIAIAAILTLINVSVYQCSKADKTEKTTITTDTVTMTDTVMETDTFCYYQPIQKIEYIERWDTLYTPKDTVPIPYKRVQYEDSVVKDNGATVLWYASVSGHNPSLDTLDFTVDYPVITNTEVVTNTIEKTIQKPAPRFSVGIQAGFGYGVFNKKPDLYIGLGGTYRF